MYAMLSEQGTACDETAICGICFAAKQEEVVKVEQLVSRSTGPDRPRPGWHRCDLNAALKCVLCGRSRAGEAAMPARAAGKPRSGPAGVSDIAIAMAVEASKSVPDSATKDVFAGRLAKRIAAAGFGDFDLDYWLRVLQKGVKRGLLVWDRGNFRPVTPRGVDSPKIAKADFSI